MRGGFRPLVNNGCQVSEVDLDATRQARQHLADRLRLRRHLALLLTVGPLDDSLIQVSEVSAADEASE